MKNSLQGYGAFIKEIKELIYHRQYEAMRQVNAELIQLYWDIGAKITERQQEKGWGKSVVDVLAWELQAEFPGVRGFSSANLWRMRGFIPATALCQISHQWCEKLAGAKTLPSWKSAKIPKSVNFTSK